MKKYHNNIKLPVPFVPFENQHDSGKYIEKVPDLKNLNKEFIDWITFDLKLDFNHGRFFNSMPFQRYPIHVDYNETIQNCNKINLVFDSYDSVMNWYEPLDPGYTGHIITNEIGVKVLHYKKELCRVAHSAPVNSHCIIDGSVAHDLVNGANNGQSRKCYTLYLIDIDTKEFISWERAMEIFSPYLID